MSKRTVLIRAAIVVGWFVVIAAFLALTYVLRLHPMLCVLFGALIGNITSNIAFELWHWAEDAR